MAADQPTNCGTPIALHWLLETQQSLIETRFPLVLQLFWLRVDEMVSCNLYYIGDRPAALCVQRRCIRQSQLAAEVCMQRALGPSSRQGLFTGRGATARRVAPNARGAGFIHSTSLSSRFERDSRWVVRSLLVISREIVDPSHLVSPIVVHDRDSARSWQNRPGCASGECEWNQAPIPTRRD